MRIVFTGGGTGGHIFPIVAIAREFNKKSLKKLKMIYIGPDEFSKETLKKEGTEVKIILAGKLRRYFSFRNLIDILKTFIGFLQSYFYLWWFMPDIIFGKGGYGSFPIVVLGWFFRIPIIIHESDSLPGLTNKILAFFAKKILVSFENAQFYFPAKKTLLTGNPIREELLMGDTNKARGVFALSDSGPVILVIGGSQGAQNINNALVAILPDLLLSSEVIHQCGPGNYEDLKKETSVLLEEAQKKYYHLFPFLNEKELSHAYKVASLIISRAGSGSINEIAALGKPSIIVPLPTAAQNHQTKNAFEFSEKSKAIVLEEPNLTPHLFLEKIKQILENPDLKREMSEGARKFTKPEAARMIVDEILKTSNKS